MLMKLWTSSAQPEFLPKKKLLLDLYGEILKILMYL